MSLCSKDINNQQLLIGPCRDGNGYPALSPLRYVQLLIVPGWDGNIPVEVKVKNETKLLIEP